MPRRDRYEDEPDDRPSRKKAGPSGLIIGLIIGGAVVALACVALCVGIVWFSAKTTPAVADNGAAGVQAGDTKKKWTRDDFRSAIMGKTPADVIAAVGRPDSTTDEPDGRPKSWYFHQRIMNPATGKPDGAHVYFENGLVSEVRW